MTDTPKTRRIYRVGGLGFDAGSAAGLDVFSVTDGTVEIAVYPESSSGYALSLLLSATDAATVAQIIRAAAEHSVMAAAGECPGCAVPDDQPPAVTDEILDATIAALLDDDQ